MAEYGSWGRIPLPQALIQPSRETRRRGKLLTTLYGMNAVIPSSARTLLAQHMAELILHILTNTGLLTSIPLQANAFLVIQLSPRVQQGLTSYRGDQMSSETQPIVKACYYEHDFESLGFHDCYIDKIEWCSSRFMLGLELGYIVKWIPPDSPSEPYRFWICPAELWFTNVADATIDLRWISSTMDVCIEDLYRRSRRSTPNGMIQWQWEVAFSMPEGNISLWATGFELRILGPPVLSNTQRLTN